MSLVKVGIFGQPRNDCRPRQMLRILRAMRFFCCFTTTKQKKTKPPFATFGWLTCTVNIARKAITASQPGMDDEVIPSRRNAHYYIVIVVTDCIHTTSAMYRRWMLQKSTSATFTERENKCILTRLYSSQVRQPRRLSSVYGTHGRIHPKSGKSREILCTRCYASRGEIELDTKPNGEHSKTPDITVAM